MRTTIKIESVRKWDSKGYSYTPACYGFLWFREAQKRFSVEIVGKPKVDEKEASFKILDKRKKITDVLSQFILEQGKDFHLK